MNRRTVLAGIAGAGILGGGAVGAHRWTQRESAAIEPHTLETLAAPGSAGGTIQIPDGDQPLLVEFFATTCRSCASFMPVLVDVHETYGTAIRFVSVTIEAVGQTVDPATVRAWWEEHDGNWTVALDPTLALADALSVIATPTSVLLDVDGTVVWQDQGVKTAAELAAELERVSDADG